MLNIAICDDDAAFVPLLRNEIEKSLSDYREDASFKEFQSGKELLNTAAKNKFSLVFLDIEMPEIDGYHLSRELKDILPEAYFVFVSGHDALVFNSYEYDPLWFVRKCEIAEVIPQVIKKYMKKTRYDNYRCQYKTESGVYTVYAADIIYIEGNKHTLDVHTVSEILKVYGSLRQEEEKLGNVAFIRPYRNYLVNIKYVVRVEEKEILLKNGERIPVSKDRKTQVKEKMLEVI